MSAVDRREIVEELRCFVLSELLADPDRALGEDEPLVSGGLIDSFAIAHIGVFIEQRFGVYLPDTELTVERMDTLRDMADVVAGWADR